MQAGLAQKAALSMAQEADWTSKLTGLIGSLYETSARR